MNDYDNMSANALAAVVRVKDEEIARLIAEKNLLLEKLVLLAQPQRNKPAGEIKRPVVLDEKTKVLRPKTDAEISEEHKALVELGILS